MRKIICIILIFISLPIMHGWSNSESLPRLHVEKNMFVDAQGQVVIFKGLNLSDPDKLERSGHWTREYFAKAREWGANIVRFPIHPRALNSRGYEAYFALVDKGINWAEELGMYVIIDWHSIGNLKDEKFQAESYRTTKKETLEFWRYVAGRYKNRDAVPFYELFNEPTDFGGQLGKATWADWKAINEEIISIIYGIDKSKIPLVAGFNWAYDLTPVKKDPIGFEGVAYVSHPYPMKREKPWVPQWEEDWGFVADTYPVMLTEIGYCFKGDKGAHIPVITDETYGPA
ncbi:MAG: cellulase family glycosylhydrolase, partial [Bacteroidales bacterium]